MALEIRTMQPEDLPLGQALCRLAGWNQTAADWQRLLTLSPDGIFVATYKGQPCATACATHYGSKTAWIGMVLVHPDCRRRNIGSSLMRHCIDYLKTKRVECIKIDASDQGRPVYLKLGFDDERPVFRYLGSKPSGITPDPDAHAVRAEWWPAIAACDRDVFGSDRLDLLKLLSTQAISAVVPTSSGVAGYGFAREGIHASYVGPIVAMDATTARRIVATLLAQLPDGEVYWDILPDNVAAKGLAAEQGFAIRRRFTRMYLGEPIHSGDLGYLYGTAGLEFG